MKFRWQSVIMTTLITGSMVGLATFGYFTRSGPVPNITVETGLEAAVGWAELDLSDISLNKWATSFVAGNPDAATFSPFGSGPANARVILDKDENREGCANVMVTITSMYPGEIPGYDAKLGATPRETVSATREVCVLGDA